MPNIQDVDVRIVSKGRTLEEWDKRLEKSGKTKKVTCRITSEPEEAFQIHCAWKPRQSYDWNIQTFCDGEYVDGVVVPRGEGSEIIKGAYKGGDILALLFTNVERTDDEEAKRIRVRHGFGTIIVQFWPGTERWKRQKRPPKATKAKAGQVLAYASEVPALPTLIMEEGSEFMAEPTAIPALLEQTVFYENKKTLGHRIKLGHPILNTGKDSQKHTVNLATQDLMNRKYSPGSTSGLDEGEESKTDDETTNYAESVINPMVEESSNSVVSSNQASGSGPATHNQIQSDGIVDDTARNSTTAKDDEIKYDVSWKDRQDQPAYIFVFKYGPRNMMEADETRRYIPNRKIKLPRESSYSDDPEGVRANEKKLRLIRGQHEVITKRINELKNAMSEDELDENEEYEGLLEDLSQLEAEESAIARAQGDILDRPRKRVKREPSPISVSKGTWGTTQDDPIEPEPDSDIIFLHVTEPVRSGMGS